MTDSHLLRRAGALLALVLTTLFATPASAQTMQLQRQSVPPPERPGTELVTPEAAREHDETVCKGVQVFWTLRGLAFSCADFQAGTQYMMVLDERQFAGGSAAAMVVLDRVAQNSRAYISDPQRPGIRLKVRFREPDADSRSVCQLISGTSTDTCREVIHFYE
jgi:hypothetical protein